MSFLPSSFPCGLKALHRVGSTRTVARSDIACRVLERWLHHCGDGMRARHACKPCLLHQPTSMQTKLHLLGIEDVMPGAPLSASVLAEVVYCLVDMTRG